jgi:hypothetical protein
MPSRNDLQYFTRRNRQEDEQARKSVEPSARRAHKQLAELHRKAAGEALALAALKSEAADQIEPEANHATAQ